MSATKRSSLVWTAVATMLALLAWTGLACAECTGPSACCVTTPTEGAPTTHVRLGLRVMRLRSISETAGTFQAELTLLYRWPAGGLRPDPRPRNAGNGFLTVLDETRLVGANCFREQRIQGDFQTWYRLRRFPFDDQLLRLNLEDRTWTTSQLLYETALWPNSIAIDAFRELIGWRITDHPSIVRRSSSFAFPSTAPHPQLMIISVPVARLWQYYLLRYFLPLFIIVGLAYGLFWIRPDDLGSAASIGVTCLLAIITFQITQSGTLPQVPYLTIADRVYIVCYLATAIAMAVTLCEAYLVGQGRREVAEALDRKGRVWFPIAFGVALLVFVALGWQAHSDPMRDVPNLLPPAEPPPGETPLV